MTTPSPHHKCGCCSKTEFEFPEELMTPKIMAMKEKLSKKEFETVIMKMMGMG